MKTRERLKSILLVALLLGAGYLTYATWFYNSSMENVSFFALLTNRVENAFVAGNGESWDTGVVVYPLAASVKQESGRFGARYDEEAVRTVFDRTYALLGAALRGAKAARSVEEKTWRAALQKPGVFYDYESEIPASVLAVWLGGADAEELANYRARYLCLCAEEDGVALYLKAGNERFRFETPLDAETLQDTVGQIAPNGAKLAVELDESVAAELLVQEGSLRPVRLRARAVSFTETRIEGVLRAFGFNPNMVSKYVEQDGTRVYIENIDTVRILPNDEIVYTDSSQGNEFGAGIFVQSASDSPTLTEQLETARVVATRLDAELGSVGRLYLYEILTRDDTVEFRFGRAVDGIPVDRQGSACVTRVTVRKNKVTGLTCQTRVYESTSETDPILPWKLAAAARRGGDLGLRYADTGGETISASWYFRD